MSETRSRLGVTDDEYLGLLDDSDHRCWICGHPEPEENRRRLAVDHDHVTGSVRGLLCTSCNRKLGASRDPEWHARAAEYLVVANRKFGDTCDTCMKPAPSVVLSTDHDNDWTKYGFACCGKRWTCGFATHGLGFWRDAGSPVPPIDRAPIGDNDRCGHPGNVDQFVAATIALINARAAAR